MDIPTQSCPHCNSAIYVTKIEIKQEINCANCGRILIIPPANSSSSNRLEDNLSNSNLADYKQIYFEPFLFLTLLCVFLSMFTFPWLHILSMVFFSFIIVSIIYNHKSHDLLPICLDSKLGSSISRLSIYPYELLLIPSWYTIFILRLTSSTYREVFSLTVLILSLILTISARQAYKKSLEVHTQSRLFSFIYSLANFLHLSKKSIKYSHSERIDASKKLFKEAENRQLLLNRIAIERAYKDDKLIQQIDSKRKKWKTDVERRYNDWINEESKRLEPLLMEKTKKTFVVYVNK